jgi:hypothetical protein
MADKPVEPMSAKEWTAFKGHTFPKGAWRNALYRQLERIEKEGVEGPEPKPLIDRIAFKFLMACLNATTVDWFKELGNRLDGLPAQEVTLKGDADAPLFIAQAEELRKKIRMPVHDDPRNSVH